MNKRVLGLIPARGGSKGVPGKNKRVVGGRPLIQFSIDVAQASGALTDIAVTTDDEEIAAIARRAGVTAIARPHDIAEDNSPVIDAIRHALAELGQVFDAIVLLQPTTPLRTAADLDAAVELYFNHGANPVCSVLRCEDSHPARMYTTENGALRPLMPEWATTRRQELPPVYHRNGALYVFGHAEVDSGNMITERMTPYVMPEERSINIDTELDFLLLQAMLERDARPHQ